MKVVATRMGFYNQILREAGEVFVLLNNPDGSVPPQIRKVQKLDEKGNPIPRKFERETVLDEKTKKPVHRDFARDLGNVLIEEGPYDGEVIHLGWMREVPEKTPVGLYPEGTDFWGGVQLPQAYVRQIGQQDRRAAKIVEQANG